MQEMNDLASDFISKAEEREQILSEASTVAEGHDDPKLVLYLLHNNWFMVASW